MSTLKELRARKATVQTIHKMILAIKAIAGVQLTRSQSEGQNLKIHRDSLESMTPFFEHVLYHPKTHAFRKEWSPYLRSLELDAPSYTWILGGDQGFCGSLYSRLLQEAIAQEQSNLSSKHTWVLIGKKLSDIQKKRFPNLCVESHWDQKPLIQDPAFFDSCLQTLLQKASEGYRCQVLWMHPQSTLIQQPKHISLLPLPWTEDCRSTVSLPNHDARISFDPDPKTVLHQLLPLLLQTQLRSCIQESCLSEASARLIAMKNASKNSEETLAHLQLQYNRLRQSKITNELIEIIAGVESH